MDWQQIVALVIVAASAVLVFRRKYGKRQRAMCGGADCRCSSEETFAQLKQESGKMFQT